MVMVLTPGKMAVSTKATTNMIRNMAKEFINGPTENVMKVVGSMANSMVLAISQIQ